MIQELKDAIDVADYLNNSKAKEILLKVAQMPENKQADTLKLVKLMVGIPFEEVMKEELNIHSK
jgi:hypothetical protein